MNTPKLTDYVTQACFDTMNEAERIALDHVLTRWDVKAVFYRDSLLGCIMGEVQGKDNPAYTMWLGIDWDGYTHS